MQILKSIFNDVKNWFIKMNLVKAVLLLVSAALLIAPAAFAFGYVFYNDNLRRENYFTVTLYDKDGNVIAEEESNPLGADESSLVGIFYLLTSAERVAANGTLAEGAEFIRAVTSYGTAEQDIKCYFSVETSEGIYTDTDGNAFLIPREANELFLGTEYSERFYDRSRIYELRTIDLDTITPQSVFWNYKNVEGEYIQARDNAVTTSHITYEITGAIDIEFEKAPDFSIVRVFDENETLYNGTLDTLSSLTVSSGNTLHVMIDAEWYENDDMDKYGKVCYDFFVRIKNRSSFTVSKTTLEAGDFVILECTNVTDISKIRFTSDRTDLIPVFSKDRETVKALLYFPENDKNSVYNFSISYGAAKQDFKLNVAATSHLAEYIDTSMSFSDEYEPLLRIEAIRSSLESISLPENNNVYFQGNFADPTSNGFTVISKHNGKVLWGDDASNSYNTIGNKYAVIEASLGGSSVSVLQNGIVAYVGNDLYLGNFVIVDHGCGLRTWYANLSSVDVKTGDILRTGQSVGKTGKDTFSDQEGFNLYCTIYNTVIDPNSIFTK